jgi:DNA-binding IclR family transcriptional regulator
MHPEPSGDRSPVESVDRALVVLEALGGAGADGVALSDLARATGLHKASLHRILSALRFRGYATQDPRTGAYALGSAAARLGAAFDADGVLASTLHPALVALSAATQELVHLGVIAGSDVVYLDKVEPERAVRVVSAIGRRNPAATTALGRALLAARGASDAGLAGYVRSAEVSRGPLDADRIAHVVAAARTTGWAVEREENEPGIACVATAVVRGEVPVAALSITAPAERMPVERVEALVAQVREVVPALLPDGLRLAEGTPT